MCKLARAKVRLVTALREYLDKQRIRPVDFAASAGLSPSMVSLYCSGERRAGLGAALKIERATGGVIPASYWVTAVLAPKDKPQRSRRQHKSRSAVASG